MLLNNLPDDCLIIIFEYLDDLSDLYNCSLVCRRWLVMINRRVRTVKYLIFYHRASSSQFSSFCNEQHIPPKILSVANSFTRRDTEQTVDPDFMENSKPLEKLVHIAESNKQSISKLFNFSLEAGFLTEKTITALIFKCEPLSDLSDYKCSQLIIKDVSPFTSIPEYTINVERFHYHLISKSWNHLKFKNLKILEYKNNHELLNFDFIEKNPILKSFYVNGTIYDVWHRRYFGNSDIKIENIEDIVLEVIYFRTKDDETEQFCMFNMFKNFPNVKHLALRNNKVLQDHNISELLYYLPKLVLLDCRGSPLLTPNAENIVKTYCRTNKKEIKFYYLPGDEQITKDWPQFSTRDERIAKGFDFMKNCFLKPFDKLPLFLDPSEDD